MFYYLSFLRPPPQESIPSAPVTITPQIANDLRTEILETTHDVFYSWSSVFNTQPIDHSSIPVVTKPIKLTTWRQASAYKEMLVPLPPGVRNGQRYSLVLTAHDQGHSHIINLAGPSCGARPLPVLSMPIDFSSRPRLDAGKQERIQRIYRIPIHNSQVFLMVTEQTSFDLDKKIWDSGIGLSSWIVDLSTSTAIKDSVKDLKRRLLDSSAADVLELGAGTGIVALTLGAIRSAGFASDSHMQGRILTTDLASAMPLLESNINQNEALFSLPGTRPQAVVLNWDNEELPAEVNAIQGGFDVILMSDVTYNTASFPVLIHTLKSLIHLYDASCKPESPLILLAYKERDPAERTLWNMAREIGIEFTRVGERVGAGGQPVEIWLGHIVILPTLERYQ